LYKNTIFFICCSRWWF